MANNNYLFVGEGMETNYKNYNSIDLLKAILSIFIVLIHVNPFAGGGY